MGSANGIVFLIAIATTERYLAVDDAEMKYVVVHLHRLLEPEGISRPKQPAT